MILASLFAKEIRLQVLYRRTSTVKMLARTATVLVLSGALGVSAYDVGGNCEIGEVTYESCVTRGEGQIDMNFYWNVNMVDQQLEFLVDASGPSTGRGWQAFGFSPDTSADGSGFPMLNSDVVVFCADFVEVSDTGVDYRVPNSRNAPAVAGNQGLTNVNFTAADDRCVITFNRPFTSSRLLATQTIRPNVMNRIVMARGGAMFGYHGVAISQRTFFDVQFTGELAIDISANHDLAVEEPAGEPSSASSFGPVAAVMLAAASISSMLM